MRIPSGLRRPAVAVAVVIAAGVGLASLPRHSAARPAPADGLAPKPIGMVGCASANCHGKPGDVRLGVAQGKDAWEKSCTVWAAVDPHTTATAVLDPGRNPIAKRMKAALATAPGYGTAEKLFDPTTHVRCLACHTNPALAVADAAPAGVLATLRAEGVGCEGCHGPAERWQGPHTGWTTATRADGLARTHMTELNDVGERAKACAGCHVGAAAAPARGWPVRDMDHDMIAAGHPRLAFDYATHLERLPPHWYERDRRDDDKVRGTSDQYKAWLVGQLAAAEAQAELSADRLSRHGEKWSELSEWNCYSCHHTLVPQSWRSASYRPGRTPGRPGWDLPWPLSDEAACEELAPGLWAKMKPHVLCLNKSTPGDAAKLLAEVLGEARKAVAELPAEQAEGRVVGVLKTAAAGGPLGWDDGYRVYLGLVAVDVIRQRGLTEAGTLADILGLPNHPLEEQFAKKGMTPADLRAAVGTLVGKLDRAGKP